MMTKETKNRTKLCFFLAASLVVWGMSACGDDSSDDEKDTSTPKDTGSAPGDDAGAEKGSDTTEESGSDTTAEFSCPGCAALSVPFTDFETSQIFNIFFEPVIDFTGATVVFRVKVKESGAGSFVTMVQNGKENGYAGISTSYAFSDLLDWVDVTMDVDTLASDAADFSAEEVFALSMILSADEDNGDELNNPTIVYVDSITATNSDGDVIPTWTFDTAEEAEALFINSYNEISGSTVDHIAE